MKRRPEKVVYLIREKQIGNMDGIAELSALELKRLNLNFDNSLRSWK